MQLRKRKETYLEVAPKKIVFSPETSRFFAFYNRKILRERINQTKNPRTEKSINGNMFPKSESCSCMIRRNSREIKTNWERNFLLEFLKKNLKLHKQSRNILVDGTNSVASLINIFWLSGWRFFYFTENIPLAHEAVWDAMQMRPYMWITKSNTFNVFGPYWIEIGEKGENLEWM